MKETEELLLSKNSCHPEKDIKQVSGKIVLIDDDKFEKGLLTAALLEKNWDVKVEYLTCSEDALDYLKKTKDQIFLIISDIDMPGLSGLDLKKAIDSDKVLRKKTIPFIFSSSSEEKEQVARAYRCHVQGYFKKPLTVDKQAEMLDIIIKYWIICKHP